MLLHSRNSGGVFNNKYSVRHVAACLNFAKMFGPGVIETRTYVVMEELKNDGPLKIAG